MKKWLICSIAAILFLSGCSTGTYQPGAMQRQQREWETERLNRETSYRIRAIEIRAREDAIGLRFPNVAGQY